MQLRMEPSPGDAAPSILQRTLFGVALAALLAAAYWSTLDWLVGRWQTDPFYSHGPLVPVVSAVLLWSTRDRFRLNPSLSRSAIAVLVAAAILHLLGVRLMFEFLSCISLLLVLAGGLLLAGGRHLLRTAAFPLLYLLFAFPLPMILLQQISLPLQLFSAFCARGVLAGFGCDVGRSGVLLVFPKFTLAVADACSGLRSLLTVLAISALAAHVSSGSLARKAGLVALSSAAALLVNILRITLAGLIGIAFDGETACLLFERYSGYFFFALVVLSTVAVFKLLGMPEQAASPAPPPLPVSMKAVVRVVLGPLTALILPMAGAALLLKTTRGTAAPTSLSDWHPALPGWRATDVRPLPAHRGEEAVTGMLTDGRDRAVRFSVLHSVSGRYLHSPEACSMAAGWIPERQEIRDVGGSPLHLWILRRGNDRACVVFWFNLAGTPRRGSIDQHVGALAQRLWRGHIDSAYGEVVVPVPVGGSADEGPLLDLAQALHGAVHQRLWPRDR